MNNGVKCMLGIVFQVIGFILAELFVAIPVQFLGWFDLLEWEYSMSMLIPVGALLAGIIMFLIWFFKYKGKIARMVITDFAARNYHSVFWALITWVVQIVASIIVLILAIGIFDSIMILPLLPVAILCCGLAMIGFNFLSFCVCRPRAN